MGAAAAILPWIIGGAAVAGTAATIISSNQASESAKKAAAEGNAKQLELEKKLYERQQGVESQANQLAVRDAAKKRQLSLAASAIGKGDTLLTGPSGLAGAAAPEAGKKTLLGT